LRGHSSIKETDLTNQIESTRMSLSPPPASHDTLLPCLCRKEQLDMVIPIAVEIVEQNPLASAGRFRGDLLRALMEVPDSFWRRNPALYERYRAALRAAAAQRRELPPEEQLEFWSALDTAAE
jgi:CDI immunity proteins